MIQVLYLIAALLSVALLLGGQVGGCSARALVLLLPGRTEAQRMAAPPVPRRTHRPHDRHRLVMFWHLHPVVWLLQFPLIFQIHRQGFAPARQW
jgi:hypothetical protein